MTVPVQTDLYNSSIANGLTTVFPYLFKIAAESDLAVEVDGVRQTTGYTVSGVGNDNGGNVTFSVAPANGKKILRYLDPVLNRTVDYPQFGDWMAAIVNLEFDRLWLAIQSLFRDKKRTLKLPVDTSTDQLINFDAATRANKGLKFDSVGNATLTTYDPDVAQSASDAAIAAATSASASATAADASAVAAAASASALPNATGSANTVPVVNSTGTGWLMKSVAQMLSFLGLGTPNAASGVVVLDVSGKLPAVDGSNLTGVSSLPSQTGHSGKVLTTDGTNASWGAGGYSGNSMVRLQASNGYGSTNTMVKRFSTVVTNQGSDITYADSAANGASFTINTSGTYAISMAVSAGSTSAFGVSLDSSQLTTAIQSITAAYRLFLAYSMSGNTCGHGGSYYLPAGSVIRPHTAGSSSSAAAEETFTITRVA